MARQISYSDVVKQIQSNIGYIPSNRNITDIKKALERGESKASVISRFSDKYQLNIINDLNNMSQSSNPVEANFANKLLSNQNFMNTAKAVMSGKIDKDKHPRLFRKMKSATAYALSTKWKDTLKDKYDQHIAPRISDPNIRAEIEKALNNLAIFEDNMAITNMFDELSYMYSYVKTTTQTFIDFLNAIHVLDEFSSEDEIKYYISNFDIQSF